MALDFNNPQDEITAQAFAGPAPAQTFHGPPPEITRADVADYLDRANWNPDQARVLAARERLSNLGVHPDVVAQAIPPSATPPVRPVPALESSQALRNALALQNRRATTKRLYRKG